MVYGKSGWRLVGALPKQNVYFSATNSGQKAIRRTAGLLVRLVPAQQPDRKLFAIVTSGLQALAMVDAPKIIGVTETLFVFRLVSLLGYAPDQSARNLRQYLQSQSYSKEQLKRFSHNQDQAVSQINQALANVQM